MKTPVMYTRPLLFIALFFCCARSFAQSTVLTTVAGTGVAGRTGDGGPAIAAKIDSPCSLVFDKHGNLYFADPWQNVVRRIGNTGIITTVAGNGTGGFSGDNGPATAAKLWRPRGIALDTAGNIYIADWNNDRIRKVDVTGIITTFAGNGSFGAAGDGGDATAAQLARPSCVAVDALGKLYIVDEYGNVRKVDASGIITRFAGGGVGGDGGAATAASLSASSVLVANNGDILIGEQTRVRSVNTAGIISTIAGSAAWGFSGDGGLATAAKFSKITTIYMDTLDNLYIGDIGNHRIRKLDAYTEKIMTVAGNEDGMGYNGFGISSTIAPVGIMVDSNGTVLIGDALAHRIRKLDRFARVSLYFDENSNCAMDATDFLIRQPVVIAVDSNGITIDTLSATGGFDYRPLGHTGDIYAYKVISAPPILTLMCPTSGIIYDTLDNIMFHIFNAEIGFHRGVSTTFDLSLDVPWKGAGVAEALGIISIDNVSCLGVDATVTATISPNFTADPFFVGVPTPLSHTSNSITWHLPDVTALTPAPLSLYYMFLRNLSLPMPVPGDIYTLQVTVSTTSPGDTDPTNNEIHIIDVVRAGFDPNDITPSPAGCIEQGTRLEYTIRFENTGNDTAFNIFVLDTLPATLDPKSMRILYASHPMNVARLYMGDRTILKFDFADINLPDSSHHGLCDGLVKYSIMPRYPLPAATEIKNSASIYFDFNPPVLTNTAWNMVDCPLSVAEVPASAADMTVYPNPATDRLTIGYTGAYDVVTISDLVGRVMVKSVARPKETVVNISTLPAGVYYLTIKGGSGTLTRRFSKL